MLKSDEVLTAVTKSLNLSPRGNEEAKADGFASAFTGLPQSVALIEAGAADARLAEQPLALTAEPAADLPVVARPFFTVDDLRTSGLTGSQWRPLAIVKNGTDERHYLVAKNDGQ